MNKSVDSGRHARALALLALFAGATAIATAPLFVRVSETGPVATAFWRIALALPPLWAWSLAAQGRAHAAAFAANRRLLVLAGLFFAGDLAVWHWSILMTSVANATLLSNLAPIFVALAAWWLFGRRPSGRFAIGLAIALAGVALLIGGDFGAGGRAALGDGLGVVTAMFYAAYQLTVTRLRARVPTATLMAWSGVFMAVPLLAVALATGERVLPATASGWATVVALALIAQAGGQTLIAYAMAHLPATFSSVGLLLQPVVAALLAWLLLGEALGWAAMAGALAVLAGIAVVHRAELGR